MSGTLQHKFAEQLTYLSDDEKTKHATDDLKDLEEDVVGVVSNNASTIEMVSYIASIREYTKNYMVRLNLTMHPKTPVRVSMKFLSTLRNEDLKKVGRSKNVNQTVRTTAKKLLDKKKKKGS